MIGQEYKPAAHESLLTLSICMQCQVPLEVGIFAPGRSATRAAISIMLHGMQRHLGSQFACAERIMVIPEGHPAVPSEIAVTREVCGDGSHNH